MLVCRVLCVVCCEWCVAVRAFVLCEVCCVLCAACSFSFFVIIVFLWFGLLLFFCWLLLFIIISVPCFLFLLRLVRCVLCVSCSV